jgi:hypothetical protein
MPLMLEWRVVGRGLDNPQILAHDGQGGLLAINKVVSTQGPPQWWLTGPNYGLGTVHSSDAEARTVAQHWADTGEHPAPAIEKT